jgi:hypothetical protein
VNHPLDVDLVEMAEHIRICQQCRRVFAHILYETDEEAAAWSALND